MNGNRRILSRPFGIEWAGWRTDTLRLQQANWELAVEVEYYRHEYRLAMRHSLMKLYAVTDMQTIDRFDEVTSPYANLANMPIFRVVSISPQIQVARMVENSPMNFRQFDATPCMVDMKIERFEDMNIFNVPMTKTEEVLINKADMTVIEHLEEIKRLQSDKQKEIRQRIITEGSAQYECKPRMHLVAQLVHYDEAA